MCTGLNSGDDYFFSKSKIILKYPNLYFYLLCSLVREAYRRPLKAEDMVDLQTELKSESAVPIFENAWRDEVQKLKRCEQEFLLPCIM
jgi:hypothetical protein